MKTSASILDSVISCRREDEIQHESNNPKLILNIFTAAARWAEVVIMSKKAIFIYLCVCVYVLDTFIQTQYKWSGQPRWLPGR